MNKVFKGLPADPTPEEILEHVKLRGQVMDMIDPVKNHARMERDRKAHERDERERARKEAYEQGVKDAERAQAKAKQSEMLRRFMDDWK